MIKCNKCGNQEHNTDINGKEMTTRFFTKVKKGFKCHGCDNIVEVRNA